jgi:hypothetical protein
MLYPMAGPFAWSISEEVSSFRSGSRPKHDGNDLKAATGDEVRAPIAGTVTRVDRDHPWNGNGVFIAGEIDGQPALFALIHFDRLADGIAVGDVVSEGQVVGYAGATGDARGTHLHLELRIRGALVDPEPYLRRARTWSADAPPRPPAAVDAIVAGLALAEVGHALVRGRDGLQPEERAALRRRLAEAHASAEALLG